MRLLKKLGWAVALLVLVAYLIASLVSVVTQVAGASVGETDALSTPAKDGKFWPRLLNDWGVHVGTSSSQLYVMLDYSGGEWLDYPQLKPHDAIPAVRVTLSLPAGVRIVRSLVRLAPPNNGRTYPRIAATSSSLNPKWRLAHPVWTYRNLHNLPKAYWVFWLNAKAGTVCVKAKAEPLYFVGGKARAIPHAPVQLGQSPGCNQSSATP